MTNISVEKSALIDSSPEVEYMILDENDTIENLRDKLTNLYESPFSDLAYLNIGNPSITEKSCYKLLVSSPNGLKHLLLFKYTGKEKKITILNECFNISVSEIRNISDVMFDKFRDVNIINFGFVFIPDMEKKPNIIFNKILNDSILKLPESMESYLQLLSTKTRKYFTYYKNRIAKELPDFRIIFVENKNITYEQISSIVRLNRSRMKTKGKTGINDSDCEMHYRYAQLNGLLCLCYNNDNIIGGTIGSIVGGRAHIHVVAHDDLYQKYSIGQISLINTIQYLIENKIKFAHLLWGESEYKHRLLCQMCDIYSVKVFRKKTIYYLNNILNNIRSKIKHIVSNLKKKMKQNQTIKNTYRTILKTIRHGF